MGGMEYEARQPDDKVIFIHELPLKQDGLRQQTRTLYIHDWVYYPDK